jgi:hypothetical protein
VCVCVYIYVNTCILGAYVNERPDNVSSQSYYFRYATRKITHLTDAPLHIAAVLPEMSPNYCRHKREESGRRDTTSCSNKGPVDHCQFPCATRPKHFIFWNTQSNLTARYQTHKCALISVAPFGTICPSLCRFS